MYMKRFLNGCYLGSVCTEEGSTFAGVRHVEDKFGKSLSMILFSWEIG